MKIFQTVQEVWSGDKCVTDGQTNKQNDGQKKAIPMTHRVLCCGELNMTFDILTKDILSYILRM